MKIPRDKTLRQLIHRTLEFVVREGPEFEALLIGKVATDERVSGEQGGVGVPTVMMAVCSFRSCTTTAAPSTFTIAGSSFPSSM